MSHAGGDESIGTETFDMDGGGITEVAQSTIRGEEGG